MAFDDSSQTSEGFVFSDANNDGLYEPAAGDSVTIFAMHIDHVEAYSFHVTTGGAGSQFFDVGEKWSSLWPG